MRDPDQFDAFYTEARGRLLLQTYALTGDLPAARSAVRDAFVVAWHHWRKVGTFDDPEGWVRPLAWRHAQRRHTARLWHRDKTLDDELAATLDALGHLSLTRRKLLLLTHLASVSLPQMAREVGLPSADAERELQLAGAEFALARDVPTTDIGPTLAPVLEATRSVRLPRSTIIRRAGAARRRTHTTIGAVGAVAAFVLTGALVTDATGARPTLDRDRGAERVVAGTPGRTPAPEPEELLPVSALLDVGEVADRVGGRGWTVRSTDDNSEGNGLATPCQLQRYADPRGNAALVRTFRAASGRGRPAMSAVQLAEVSQTTRAARRAFDTELGWYAGCTTERVQLLATRRVTGVGDQAMLLVLRAWAPPAGTLVVGVARSGRVSTVVLTRRGDDRQADLGAAAQLLGAAVGTLCETPAAGACSRAARAVEAPPVPVGRAPGMLSEIDLPPVGAIRRPWVGTEPRRASDNSAATACDGTSFDGRFEGAPITNNLTRSFVIPEAGLPPLFGLTQSVGTLPARRAGGFVDRVRRRMAACPDAELGTDVVQLVDRSSRREDLGVWELTVEVSDQKSVRFMMAIARRDTAVTQIGFSPTDAVRMPEGAFEDLAERALDRLQRMPPPGAR